MINGAPVHTCVQPFYAHFVTVIYEQSFAAVWGFFPGHHHRAGWLSTWIPFPAVWRPESERDSLFYIVTWMAGRRPTVPSNLSSKFRLLYRAWHGIVVSLLLNDLFLLWVIRILDLNLESNPAD